MSILDTMKNNSIILLIGIAIIIILIVFILKGNKCSENFYPIQHYQFTEGYTDDNDNIDKSTNDISDYSEKKLTENDLSYDEPYKSYNPQEREAEKLRRKAFRNSQEAEKLRRKAQEAARVAKRSAQQAFRNSQQATRVAKRSAQQAPRAKRSAQQAPRANRRNSEPAVNRRNSEPAVNRRNSEPAENRRNSEPAENRRNSEPDENRENRENFSSSSKQRIMLFYAPWCPHCVTLRVKDGSESKFPEGKPDPNSEWGKVFNEYKKSNIYDIAEIDCEKRDKIASQYNVSGFPTIILIKNNKQYEFSGDRNYAEITKFIVNPEKSSY